MELDVVESVDGVPIRLTEERWEHIIDSHPEMSGHLETVLDAVAEPEFICRGQRGTKIAVLNIGRRKFLQVFYRELKGKKDGFIITAYIDSEFDRNTIIWRRQ